MTRSGKRFVSAAMLILWLMVGLALPALAEEYPAPPIGLVADYAGILTAPERSELAAILGGIKTKTTCQVAFVTLRDTGNVPAEQYRVNLFNRWGIGEKGKDNGLLVLYVTRSRTIQIEVGYGLEPIITDSLAGRLLDEYAVPALKQDKYGEGLLSLANALSPLLIAKYDPIHPPTSSGLSGGARNDPWAHTDWFSVYLLFFGPPVALIIIAVLNMYRVFAPRCPECHSKLRVWEECITPATNDGPGQMKRIRHCDNCLYHIETTYTVMGLGAKPSRRDFWFFNTTHGGGAAGGAAGGGASGGGFGGGSSGGGGAGRSV